MLRNVPQFLIAAPTSGTGKTTVSRLLMTLLTQKGLRVQPYKCGPDYIDTKYHEKACGVPSYNLDLFMATETHVQDIYTGHAQEADVCVVEGMMGLFDGYDRDKGSSAEVAKSLHLPVVLVVDGRSAGYSMAALIAGFRDFDRMVEVAGVIFNHVGSDHHEQMLREACDDLQMVCFGCLRSDDALKEKSRHLGLDFSRAGNGGFTKTKLKEISRRLDIDLLLEVTTRELNISETRRPNRIGMYPNIWVARNKESFSFIYAEHLDWLARRGKITFFDPEDNSVVIPQNINLLYLPGGYPENRAKQLSRATNVKNSIKEYIERGGYTLAECGGMMYLASALKAHVSPDTHIFYTYDMVGVLPLKISACKQDARLSLGYRAFTYRSVKMTGHEFHYSQIMEKDTQLESIVQVKNARGENVDTPVFRYKNLVASYVHLYWAETGLNNIF